MILSISVQNFNQINYGKDCELMSLILIYVVFYNKNNLAVDRPINEMIKILFIVLEVILATRFTKTT